MDPLPSRAREVLPMVLPVDWRIVSREPDDCGFAAKRGDGLAVIATVGRESDGRAWLHVSLSRHNRLPSWPEVKAVKELFVGRQRQAFQVLPSEAEYVNLHPNCLHLWCCLDGDPVPNFARDRGGTI